jgi:hypothetical protein
MHPIMKMTQVLQHSAHIGASNVALILDSFEEAMKPESRAKDHVKREAVCNVQVNNRT